MEKNIKLQKIDNLNMNIIQPNLILEVYVVINVISKKKMLKYHLIILLEKKVYLNVNVKTIHRDSITK